MIIFDIHIGKRGRNSKKFKVAELVKQTDGYTGAEIEQVVIDSMFTAFGRGEEISTDHIAEAIEQTSPMSVINGSQIAKLRDWSKDRCRTASHVKKSKPKAAPAKKSGRKINVATEDK